MDNTASVKKQEFEGKCERLFDLLLDERCEMFGVRNTIAWLIDNGITDDYDLIVRLGFDEADVKEVKEADEEALEKMAMEMG